MADNTEMKPETLAIPRRRWLRPLIFGLIILCCGMVIGSLAFGRLRNALRFDEAPGRLAARGAHRGPVGSLPCRGRRPGNRSDRSD